ncbi:N-acetyl-6-hydroxytryptophan oxidase ivoB [Colletotrichum siamense]|uniref:N-acetyl-6-hydroxytryptophan oxidase ivoB n=1 Tax=Colletotrichum siamense TaxID=690259 RepID=A0A9P5EP89_COLSI|nr:N-acetyl-6-hydroxytryptophan oxidase ivoB [Colletotrichum siamense]KAF4855799.1 N-acetyl-6-hydroxytryptophan oxidase ivoB [Colletotrichum siamense]
MKPLSVFVSHFLALTSVRGVASAPSNSTGPACCRNPLIRHEWRQLSLEQRLDYIGAVKCLMSLPSEGNELWPGARSRYNDFQGLHIRVTEQVHFNGPFLPWHRWLLYLFESELRNKCSYQGGLPYWDISLDNTAESFVKSPIFDNVYGFGGNGPYIQDLSDPEEFPTKTPTEIPNRTGGGCVQEGPFANLTVPMGLGASVEYQPHCLRRDFSPTLVAAALADEVIDRALSAPIYDEFNHHIQGYSFEASGITLHAGMHLGIGGQVGENADMYSSPGDPIFYFIHSALDKIWNDWQRRDWPARKTAIGGPDAMFAYPFNFFGDVPYENITLQYPLSFPNFGKDMVVSDVMDIRGGPFCYEYQ